MAVLLDKKRQEPELKLWETPQLAAPCRLREQTTEVDGYRMHALVAGEGSPLVLVHGLLGAACCWVPAMQRLAHARRVYAVDALGIGRSERVPAIDGSLHALARRLRVWMEREGMGQVDLLGTSHGGAVAMAFASLFPRRVRSLVLHAPANPFCLRSQPQIRFAGTALGRSIARLLPVAPSWIHHLALRRMYGDPRRLRAGSLAEYVGNLHVPGTVDYVLTVLRTWLPDMAALLPALPRLRGLPCLLLWGALDRAVSLASGEQLSQALHAPLEVLPGLGHLPFEEAPEVFAARVLRFLEAQGDAIEPGAVNSVA